MIRVPVRVQGCAFSELDALSVLPVSVLKWAWETTIGTTFTSPHWDAPGDILRRAPQGNSAGGHCTYSRPLNISCEGRGGGGALYAESPR